MDYAKSLLIALIAAQALWSGGVFAQETSPALDDGGSEAPQVNREAPLAPVGNIEPPSDLVEVYSAKVLKEYQDGTLKDITGRDQESRQITSALGIESEFGYGIGLEASGYALLEGDNKTGRTTTVKKVILDNPGVVVLRVLSEKFYTMDKNTQGKKLKELILLCEKFADSIPGRKVILYFDNTAEFNRGSASEVRPISAVTEAIASKRKIPMLLEVDSPTAQEVFRADSTIKALISEVKNRSPQFDELLKHLRRIKAQNKTLLLSDVALIEIAYIVSEYPSRRPFELAEKIASQTSQRVGAEAQSGVTESRALKAKRQQIKDALDSVIMDSKNGGDSEEAQKRIASLEKLLEETQKRINDLNIPATKNVAEASNLAIEIKLKADRYESLKLWNVFARWNLYWELRHKRATLRNLYDDNMTAARPDEPHKIATAKDVQIVAAEALDVPLSVLSQDPSQNVKNLVELNTELFNMKHQIDMVATALSTHKFRAPRPQDIGSDIVPEKIQSKPASIAVLGMSGTGKSELAKSVARKLGIPILTLNMTEYMEKHSVSKLLGAPPGYKGFDEGGLLTNFAEQNPGGLIFIEEGGREHPDVFQVLMQAMDEGFITDSRGRKVFFNRNFFMYASNKGQVEVSGSREQLKQYMLDHGDVPEEQLDSMSDQDLRDEVARKALSAHYNDDAIAGRFTITTSMNPHTPESIEQLVHKTLTGYIKTAKETFNVDLYISDQAKDQLIKSYRPEYGGRSIRNAYERYFKMTMNKNFAMGQFKQGDTMVIDFDSGVYSYSAVDSTQLAAEIEKTKPKEAKPKKAGGIDVLPPSQEVAEQGKKQLLIGEPEKVNWLNEKFMIREAVAKVLVRLGKK